MIHGVAFERPIAEAAGDLDDAPRRVHSVERMEFRRRDAARDWRERVHDGLGGEIGSGSGFPCGKTANVDVPITDVDFRLPLAPALVPSDALEADVLR